MTDTQRAERIADVIPGARADRLSIAMVRALLNRTKSPALRIDCQRWLGTWGPSRPTYQSPDQFIGQQHRRDTMGQGDHP